VLALAPLLASAWAQSETEPGRTFDDPAGRFSVPVPTGWTAQARDGHAHLASPDGGIEVRVLVLENDDAAAAVAEAWRRLDPGSVPTVDDVVSIPTSAMNTAGVDEFVLVNYEREDDDPIVQAEGRRLGDTVFVLLFEAELESVQRRAAQLQIVDSGFTITALEQDVETGTQALPLDAERIAELERFVAEQMETFGTVGAAVSVVRGGEVVYARGFGVRDLGTNEPVTPETLMMVGSTTKPLTTTLMAQLVDEGVFDWDTPVARILPTFAVADPELSRTITMENLVCACTGVPRRDYEWLFNADEITAEDVVESLADFAFFTDFGEAFQYSNQMVATAGYVTALAAGGAYGELYEDYAELLASRVLDPLGMDRSTFSVIDVLASGNRATPYAQLATGETVAVPLPVEETLQAIAPAGALWSNATEMSSYLRMLLDEGVAPGGTRIVSADALAETWRPRIAITADASYGLGWIVEDDRGVRIVSHSGNTFGFTSELAFAPELDLGISVLTNQRLSPLNAVVRAKLLELLLDRTPELDEQIAFQRRLVEQSRAEAREALLDEIDRAAVAPWLGTFRSDVLGDITLAFEGDDLTLDVGEFAVEVRATRDDEGEIDYVGFTPPLVGLVLHFEEGNDGRPVVRFGEAAIRYAFEKVE
jgi:CubicO group peptidase (beta-lactamase class C family)